MAQQVPRNPAAKVIFKRPYSQAICAHFSTVHCVRIIKRGRTRRKSNLRASHFTHHLPPSIRRVPGFNSTFTRLDQRRDNKKVRRKNAKVDSGGSDVASHRFPGHEQQARRGGLYVLPSSECAFQQGRNVPRDDPTLFRRDEGLQIHRGSATETRTQGRRRWSSTQDASDSWTVYGQYYREPVPDRDRRSQDLSECRAPGA